jgi:hypothetical protein
MSEILCIIPGPSHVYRTEPDDRETRWCFRCRKRLPHVWKLIGDPPDVVTYYENQWVIECSGCGEDHTYFPGCGPL